MNILILALYRHGDFFYTAKTVSLLKEKYPSANISMLIPKNFIRSATTLNSIFAFYPIDREIFQFYKKSSVFSPAESLNYLSEFIAPLKEKRWDLVINLSNGVFESYLSNYLEAKETIGVSQKRNGKLSYSNKWACYLNEISTLQGKKFFHQAEIQHHLCALENTKKAPYPLKLDPKIEVLAEEKITSIKVNNSLDSIAPQVIGIQLSSSSREKNIPIQTYCYLFKILSDLQGFVPVALISSSDEDKQMVEKISHVIENQIISLEADFGAISSVLKRVNLLITPDTSIKHLADINHTPSIEVAFNQDKIFQFGTQKEKKLILLFDKKTTHHRDMACDILNTLKFFENNIQVIPSLLKSGKIYRATKDISGICYIPIGRSSFSSLDLNYLCGRIYFQKLFLGKINEKIIQVIQESYSKKEITTWAEKEKNNLAESIKGLLRSIKSVRQCIAEKTMNSQLLEEISFLVNFSQKAGLISLPATILKGQLENMGQISNIEQDGPQIEERLYKFKSSLQVLTQIITNINLNISRKPSTSPENLQL